jgi:hypothetical protein
MLEKPIAIAVMTEFWSSEAVSVHRTIFVLALGLSLSACAQRIWNKPGATQQDFATDSYACEKDARQSGYFGGGLTGALNMQEFDDRCMVAHGWHLSNQTSPTQPNRNAELLKSAVEERKACTRSVRSDPAYGPILPHLSDPDTGRFSIAQLADDHVPTSAEAKLLVPYGDAIQRCVERFVATASQLAPATSAILTQVRADSQTLLLQLIRREITWSTEAQRQQTIQDDATAKLRELHL